MMRVRWWAPAALLLAIPAMGGASPAAPPAKAGQAPRFEAVTFAVRNRVFHDFRHLQRVKMNQDFPLGDGEYSARVVQFLPDFQMDLKARKVFSMSDQPRNPAFKVVVRKGKTPQDTTWAFLKSPPHFGARSYFAFQVLMIEFANREPIVADTSAAAHQGSPHGTSAPKDTAKGR